MLLMMSNFMKQQVKRNKKIDCNITMIAGIKISMIKEK
jgi:hypothetical protein